MFGDSSLDLFGSPAALLFPCSALDVALCAASPSVVIVLLSCPLPQGGSPGHVSPLGVGVVGVVCLLCP